MRMLGAILAGGLAASPILVAAQAPAEVDLGAERIAIERFQDIDQRLQDVGWQLVRGNADFCANAIPSIGLQLQDLASYGQPQIARAALEMTGDFSVQTAARASPAASSGQFPRNREVTALAGVDPNSWEAGERLYWQRLAKAHDHIDASLASDSSITIAFADGTEEIVTPVKACATRFELAGSGDRAVADGSRVVIGQFFKGFEYREELFAGVVAHELAHNLLGHRQWLDRNGRSRKNVRATEREADRLMPWLLANAGYPPEAAAEFFRTYQPSSGSVLFIKGSHAKWKDRAKTVEVEIEAVNRLLAREGNADWSLHFKREIDPLKGL